MVAFIEQLSETITESLSGAAQVDETSAVIRGVKLIGFESKNGRSYPPSVLKSAVNHYEGTVVNLDHPAKPTDSRSIRDRIGVIRSARYVEGQGVYGDFHYNPKHAAAEQIVWDAANNPSAVGFSHNANLHLRREGGKTVVESIAGVRSMDLVADPATTSGFFESVTDDATATEGVIADKIAADDRWQEIRRIVDTACGLLNRQLYGDDKDPVAVSSQLVKIASDLVAELAAVKLPTPSEGDSEMSSETEQKQELESLKAELAALKAEKQALQFKAAVEAELQASKLTTEQISEPFRKVLLATESADDRAALIADREAVFATESTQLTKPSGNKPRTTPVTEGQQSLTAEQFLARIRK